MKTYAETELAQRLAEALDLARTEDVIIRRSDGTTFVLSYRRQQRSPLDVPGVRGARATTADIVDAVRYAREQPWQESRQKGRRPGEDSSRGAKSSKGK